MNQLVTHFLIWSSLTGQRDIFRVGLTVSQVLSVVAGCHFFNCFAAAICSGPGQGWSTLSTFSRVQWSSRRTCSSSVNWPCLVLVSDLTWAHDDKAAAQWQIQRQDTFMFLFIVTKRAHLCPDHPPSFWHKTHHHTQYLCNTEETANYSTNSGKHTFLL